jgi:hypothetical protein
MNHENARARNDARSTPIELDARRVKVLTLRLHRMTQAQISTALAIDQTTVSRDLTWIAQHWKERFGVPAALDPSQEIGEAIALFADIETSALVEFDTLTETALQRGLSLVFISKQRMACLRTAMEARQRRVSLLQGLGLLDRQPENIGVTLGADGIRQALRDEGLLPRDGSR